jgi:endonuclease YncB( thermonuclease family)
MIFATLIGLAIIVDGDTLRIGGERIRLHAIDAPEIRQSCQRGPIPVRCGLAARDQLAAIVSGRQVRCEGRQRDKYRRLVATCSVGGRDLGEAMVRSGWALAYRRYGLRYVPAEDTARQARRGLWSMQFQEPESFRQR